jgi:hypothetical protein
MRFSGIRRAAIGGLVIGLYAGASVAQQRQDNWMTRAMGQYGGRIIGAVGPLPHSMELDFTSGGAIEGDYGFSEHGARHAGRLDACTVTRPFAIACRWHDKNGDGALEMIFARDLGSFVGRWNRDGEPEKWRSWFGRKLPSI